MISNRTKKVFYCISKKPSTYTHANEITLRASHKTYRDKLPQLNASLTKHSRCLLVHAIPMGIHDLADAHLADLDTASQARTRIAVEHGAISDSFPTRFEEGIFLRMDTQTGGETDARTVPLVAAGAASVGAVADPARCTIVSGADNAALSADEDASYTALHAVGALGGKGC